VFLLGRFQSALRAAYLKRKVGKAGANISQRMRHALLRIQGSGRIIAATTAAPSSMCRPTK